MRYYKYMGESAKEVDIWKLLEEYEKEYGNPVDNLKAATKPKTDEETAKNKKKLKHSIALLDMIGILFWAYIFVQLFLYSIDTKLITLLGPDWSWLIQNKFLILFGLLAIVGLLFWRAGTILAAIYLLFFPLIFSFWKVPRALYKAKQWLGVMIGINALGLAIKNLRYNLISKGLGLVAVFLILSTNNTFALTMSAIVLLGLLTVASYRTVKLTVSTDWFLQIQEKAIKKVVDSGFVNSMTQVSADVQAGKVNKLDVTSYQALTNSISNALLINRGLYFWAYQLQRYRQTSMAIFFNVATFVWLLIGSILVFWLIDLAIYKIDPTQFTPSSGISNLAMLVYSMSNFFFSDGAGISANGDLAYLSRIAAGLFGAVFLLTIIGNILMTTRQSKNNEALNSLVTNLKERAQREDDVFKERFALTPKEGFERLQKMQQGLHMIIASMVASIPSDFFDKEVSEKSK